MRFSISYSEFECEVTTTLGVSCGLFTYSVAQDFLAPDDPTSISSISVDPVGQTIDVEVVKGLIPTGLVATLSLKGTL